MPLPSSRAVPATMAERLIVALDVPSVEAAREAVSRIGGVVRFYKIGYWLLFAPGAEAFLDRLLAAGNRVFLDAKMYDIGETVKQGAARAAERGVSFLTVHGDPEILRAAVAGRGASPTLQILAVTVLTSLNAAGLAEMGYGGDLASLVAERARSAAEAGCDGIIASAADDPARLRAAAGAPGLLVVTPGIRPAGGATDDHKRPANPAEAVARGADYLVIGRPILRAADPAAAASAVIAEMERGAGGG